MSRLKKVLVVGGGTAGWLAACYLAKALNAVHPDGVQVHLVESDNIGLLGVGEATFPSIRGTLSAIGLDERRFLVGATATWGTSARTLPLIATRPRRPRTVAILARRCRGHFGCQQLR